MLEFLLKVRDREPNKVALQLRFEAYCSVKGVAYLLCRRFDSTVLEDLTTSLWSSSC